MDAITVRCTKCEHTMRFGPDKAGRTAKCPRCGNAVVIPTLAAAPPPVPAVPSPPSLADDDGPADYGLVDVGAANPTMAENEKQADKKKKKLPKLERKIKALPNLEEWDKVRNGILFVFFGACVWLFAHLLHGLYVVLGNIEFPEYARGLTIELERRGPLPPAGQFWDVDQLNMLLGMISGQGLVGFARGTLTVCILLTLVQAVLWFTGYGFCFVVPPRFGTFGSIVGATSFGVVNFLVTIFVRLLPVFGVYNLIVIPLLVPEVSLVEYNIERSLPINVLWSAAPFWENFATLVIELILYLEPVLFAEFLWAVGLSIKDRNLAERGHAVVQLGLGQYAILVAYHMMAISGTSTVLVIVLKVLYVMWFSFLILFIVWFIGLLLKTREVLFAKMYPLNEAE